MRKLDDIYRETLWKTSLTTTDFPYIYASGGAYGFLQAFADVYKYLVNETVGADLDYFLEKQSDDLSANIEDYYLPNDLIRLRYIEMAMDGVNFFKAEQVYPSQFATSEQALVSGVSQSHPKFWILGSTTVPSAHIQVAPRPTVAVTDGIKMYYDRMPSALFSDHVSGAISAASAVVMFPQQFDWLIPMGISVELWGKFGQRENKIDEIQKYQKGIEDLKRSKPRVATGTKRFKDFREFE